MTQEQMEQYIELQRQLIVLLQKRLTGHTMEELKVIKQIQDFEDSLPCNQD